MSLLNKLKEKKGLTLVGVLLGAIAFGALALPIARWVIAMSQNLNMDEKKLSDNSERIAMQSIIQGYWNQINSAPYAEFEDKIRTRGRTWSENVMGKYTLNVSFGNEGKYVSAACNTSIAPGSNDKSCRTATIKLTSKTDTSKVETVSATKISTKPGPPESVGDNLPVGTILPYKGSTANIPKKWALCNGQTVNGVTTPNLSGRFLQGSTSSAGSFISAGVPNITGSSGTALVSGGSDWTGTRGEGALRITYLNKSNVNMVGGAKYMSLTFDASRCSSIYGNSSTVQPPAYTVLYIMKVKE